MKKPSAALVESCLYLALLAFIFWGVIWCGQSRISRELEDAGYSVTLHFKKVFWDSGQNDLAICFYTKQADEKAEPIYGFFKLFDWKTEYLIDQGVGFEELYTSDELIPVSP